MERMVQFIPRLVVPYFGLFILVVLLSIVWGFQSVVYYGVQDSQVVWEGSCDPTGLNENGELRLMVDCGEQGEITFTSNSLIRSYHNNPGPLICKKTAADNFKCTPLQEE